MTLAQPAGNQRDAMAEPSARARAKSALLCAEGLRLRNASTFGVVVCASLALVLLTLRLQGAAPRATAAEYLESQEAQRGFASPGPTFVTPTPIGTLGIPATLQPTQRGFASPGPTFLTPTPFAPSGVPPTSSSSQDLANQIATVADQVAAVVRDATIPGDL